MNTYVILQDILIIVLILGLESILSFDNIAVLSLIVNKNLPSHQRNKALKYGILGAFLFRGLCLFFVSWIINNPSFGAIFKVVGGAYLLWLAYKGITPKADSIEEGNVGWADRLLKKLGIGIFWSTVIVIEMVDIVFSLDNLVAVIGMSNKFYIIIIGVFLGIITMRFIATLFVKLMGKYKSLEKSAFVVILLLGLKLIISGTVDYIPSLVMVKNILESHLFDLIFSGCMMAIFFVPLLFKKKIENQEVIQPHVGYDFVDFDHGD